MTPLRRLLAPLLFVAGLRTGPRPKTGRVLRAGLAVGTGLVAVAATPTPAHAADVAIGLGAHYWFTEQGLFDAYAVVRQPLLPNFSIGFRAGVLLTASPTHVGIPLDFLMRVDVSRVYFEAAAGPWFLIDSGDTVRVHVSGGFGLKAGNITFGPEVGWLDPRAVVGARFTYRL